MADETARRYLFVFIDRFTCKRKEPFGQHAFDRECALLVIEHLLIKRGHPQTNGMVERCNGRISDVLVTTRVRSCEDLQTTMQRYLKLYNEHLPQRVIGHKTPLQAMRVWREQRPNLFVRRPKNQTGLDMQLLRTPATTPAYHMGADDPRMMRKKGKRQLSSATWAGAQ